MQKFLSFYSVFLFTSLLILSCSSQDKVGPNVSGTILNLENDYVIISKVDDIQSKKTSEIDTLYVDNQGNFQSEILTVPNIYSLSLNDKKTVLLAIDNNQNIVVEGIGIDSIHISGSSDTDLLIDYETFRKASLNRLVTSVRTKVSKLKKEGVSEEELIKLRALEVENYKIHLDELTQFIQQKMGSSIAIYPTSIRWNNENIDVYKKIVLKFMDSHPNSEISKKLENKIQVLQKTAVGSRISNIQMPTQEGLTLKLDSIGKTLTLIDFWASWCPPCRTESKLLNELYQNYNSKGFEIYGISLDSKKQRWINALEKDNRNWANVSTLEGFKTPIVKEFGISALPTNLLIDSEGTIVASNIHGNQLKQFIDNLFEN